MAWGAHASSAVGRTSRATCSIAASAPARLARSLKGLGYVEHGDGAQWPDWRLGDRRDTARVARPSCSIGRVSSNGLGSKAHGTCSRSTQRVRASAYRRGIGWSPGRPRDARAGRLAWESLLQKQKGDKRVQVRACASSTALGRLARCGEWAIWRGSAKDALGGLGASGIPTETPGLSAQPGIRTTR